ncbi:MAG: MFS transporter [Pseudomonadota bacterium]|jgi:MFS family permease|nr:MFS transporter [Pseudomonadota bacterium]
MSAEPRGINGSLWALAALGFAGGLGGGVVFPILPIVGQALGIAPAMIGLILSLNRITRLGVNPFTGHLVDRFGARWPLTCGLLIEGLATLCYTTGLASRGPTAWFLLGRALWGVGSSLLMVGALTGALIVSTPAARGRATALVRMALSFGVPAGLLLGGLVANLVSVRAAFLAATFITFGGMIVAFFIAPHARRAASTPREHPTAPPGTVLRELLRPGPLWIIWLFNFIVFFSAQGVILASLVLIVHERHLMLPGLNAEGSAGTLMAVMLGTSAIVSWIAGRAMDRRGRRSAVLLPAAACLACGFGVLAFAHTLLPAAVALGIIGIGLGGISVPLIVIMGELIRPEYYGRAVGIYQVAGDIGGSLGPITGLEAITRFGPRDPLAVLAALLLITVPLALVLIRFERRPRH